jgi:GTP pyrophosphokinase
MQQDVHNPREFMSSLKLALFPDEVYVFTPNGDVRAFPKGATPVDFAYSIHTDIGHQCIGAKVNRNIVPLKYVLKNGDTVEILTQAGHHPSKDWLKFVVTSKAISRIKSWVNTEERKKSIGLGKALLEKEFKKHHLKFNQVVKSDQIKTLSGEYSIKTLDDLLATVGYGRLSPKHVVNLFLPDEATKKEEGGADKAKKKTPASSPLGISLTGVEDVLVRFAKCCDPIPGDAIIGYISRGRGVTIHSATCPTVQEMESERLISVEWAAKEKNTYPVHLRAVCRDHKGVLAEISAIISSFDVNISHAEIETNPDMQAICDFRIDVRDLNQFNKIVADIKKLDGIISVERVRKLM